VAEDVRMARHPWDRDVREAMKGRDSFRVHTSPSMIAACLWDCGEAALAERALAMTPDELRPLGRNRSRPQKLRPARYKPEYDPRPPDPAG
jgi:hypothetical protein